MANENACHRKRLRARMINEGLSGFQDHEVLELLLFQSIPRSDTNKLAHSLLNKFGSIAGVLNASPKQLMTVKGVSEVTACNLSMLKEVWRRYKRSDAEKISLSGVSSILRYAQTLIEQDYVERLVAVYVDYSTNFLFSEDFTSESIRHVNVEVKKIVETVMRINAAGVILFHVHVGGKPFPGDADKRFTEKLYFSLATLNSVLLEHIIFNSDGDYYSFVQAGDMAELSRKYVKTMK